MEPWRDEKTEKIFCPVNGWDCSYWQKDGSCTLKHIEACEDFYFFWKDEIEERIGNKCKKENVGL